MFRLYDAATGKNSSVTPVRGAELRIWVAGPALSADPGQHPSRPADPSRPSQPAKAAKPGHRADGPAVYLPIQMADLQPCLVADLVRRVAERHNLRVRVWRETPASDSGAGAAEELRAAWHRLNIHPAEFAARPPDPLDVAVAPADQRASGSPSHRLQPGEVTPEAPDVTGLDPLAVRLAFLEHHYRAPVNLARQTLEAADRALRRWRGLVADWAHSPSKPMCAQYTGEVLAAFDEDLDTPSALRTLHALAADDQIPPGSKFESFAYLDRLLGIDLASEVGH